MQKYAKPTKFRVFFTKDLGGGESRELKGRVVGDYLIGFDKNGKSIGMNAAGKTVDIPDNLSRYDAENDTYFVWDNDKQQDIPLDGELNVIE